MRPLAAFLKKEYLEAARTGKLMILVLLFVLFGVMNPAIAKLTPWMLEMLSASLEESGFAVTNVQVDALTSWTQFFKNIPMALIAFALLFSDSFTKEYRSGTLLLVLTKGLARYKVVLAKTVLLLSLWTLGYGLCFCTTYGYTAYFWDNSIAHYLLPAVGMWWLFGAWVICLMVLFSSLLGNNTGVTLCTGGIVVLAYLWSLIPKAKAYSPAMLMNAGSLLPGMETVETYMRAVVVAAVTAVILVAVSVLKMNKRQV